MIEQQIADNFRFEAQCLVKKAARVGVIITIEQKPREPLAQGNYESVVTTRINHRMLDK